MVRIQVRQANKVSGEKSLFITFDFSYQILDIIKALPSRIYNPDNREWEVPSLLLDKLRKSFSNEGIEYSIQGLEFLNKVKVSYDYEFKTKPLKHQLEGIDYGLSHSCFLLGDEMGLGKTKQALDLACIRKQRNEVKKCLIVCGVNALKFNWLSEIKTHTNQLGWILGMRKKKNGKYRIGSTADKIEDIRALCGDCFFMITNIETFRNRDFLRELEYQKNNIDMIILDEAHTIKNPNSQQSKGFLKFKPKFRLAMSGTFMLNRPLELYVPLNWIDYYKDNYWKFTNSFMIKDDWGNIIGLKNGDLLRSMIRDCMLRRLKSEVLDLPDKTYMNEYLEMGSEQQTIYDEVIKGIKENIDKIRLSHNPLVEMIRARQATEYPNMLSSSCNESVKFDRVVDLVEQISANGNKCLIFSNWAEMIEAVASKLTKYNPAIITGKYNDVKIEEQKEKFLKDTNCKVACGTIGKMGTGLTLTEANYVIFLDEPWNKGLKEQAVDRTHRIGQTKKVTIITLLCKDTIDERINQLVESKGYMSSMLLDDNITISKADVDFLLS